MRALPPKFLSAMVALQALPGSPLYGGDDSRITDQALSDVADYKKVGVDSLLIENDFDVPYIRPPFPDEAMDLIKTIAKKVREEFAGPIGLQLLEAANEESLEIAAETDL